MTQNSIPSSNVHDEGKYNSSKNFAEVIGDLNSISVLDKTSESEMSQIKSKQQKGCGFMALGGALIFVPATHSKTAPTPTRLDFKEYFS